MATKLLVLGVVLACHQCATHADPAPRDQVVAHNADLPIHRAIRAVSFAGQARPGVHSRPGGVRPGRENQTAVPVGQCSNCVPLVACAPLLEQISSTCELPDGGFGVCCPPLPPPSVGKEDNRLLQQTRVHVKIRSFSRDEVDSAVEEGRSFLNEVNDLESRLVSSRQVLEKSSAAYGHLKFFDVMPSARKAHQAAQEVVQASRAMMSEFNLTPRQGGQGLRDLSVRQSSLAGNCPVAPQCNPTAKYRTTDGSCNNLANPLWGKSETALQRVLPPYYDDGVSSPRTLSVDPTGSLPLERRVSRTIMEDQNHVDPDFTLSVMQWAQFIDHDITHVPFPSMENGDGIECCSNGAVATGPNVHPSCWPIVLPPNDPTYSPTTCMNFVRSMLGLTPACNFGYAEQLNQLTHWLDGSNIYGSTALEAARLRANVSGRLTFSAGDLLPVNPATCDAQQRGGVCFFAGDSRVDEQPGLTAIHIIFHREHNRVAAELLSIHPGWSDEALYQEARRIVVAEYQHIVYNEWLPIIVGFNFMLTYGLSPLPLGYRYSYLPNIEPTINNEFAASAFRFGHSLVQGFVNLYGANGQVSQTLQLRNHFNSPHVFQTIPGVVDMFARSFTRQAIQKFDSFVTTELTNHLFQAPGASFGMDLISINLHRGRDHGIAPYNEVRVECGLRRALTFDDFADQIPIDIVRKLESLYAHPDDVDFFAGGLSERPVPGGLLGWTFLCVVGDQFARLQKGDRFFYDHGGQPGSFTIPQLNQIRRASWARILCDNTKIGTVQPLAFLLPFQPHNLRTSCTSYSVIPRVDIKGHWASVVPQA